ncbi:endonuclease domain-containing protein [Streptosporangium vulgare]|uniref:endonuclease domain-containing protein n=1 Tax=Streptosporangium vulgare TaxID=46190 RepID=UPI003CD085F8
MFAPRKTKLARWARSALPRLPTHRDSDTTTWAQTRSRRDTPRGRRSMRSVWSPASQLGAATRPRPHNGRLRGWLCGGCNAAIGHAGDNPIRLRALADYLDKKAR